MGDRSIPATPAPSNGNINNHTKAIISPVTKMIGLNHFGPQSDGAIPAKSMANRIPLL